MKNTFEQIAKLNNSLNLQNQDFRILVVSIKRKDVAKILVPAYLVELCKNEVLALMPNKYKNSKINFDLYGCKKAYYKISSVFMGSFVKIKDAINKTDSYFSQLYESAKSKISNFFASKKETKTESLPQTEQKLEQVEPQIEQVESQIETVEQKLESQIEQVEPPKKSNKGKGRKSQTIIK